MDRHRRAAAALSRQQLHDDPAASSLETSSAARPAVTWSLAAGDLTARPLPDSTCVDALRQKTAVHAAVE